MNNLAQIIRNKRPDYWVDMNGNEERFELSPDSLEYRKMDLIIRTVVSVPPETKWTIERYQNLNYLGQVLLGEELDKNKSLARVSIGFDTLLKERKLAKYTIMVRKFIKIKKDILEDALKYNLSSRKCKILPDDFRSYLNYDKISINDVVVAVQVLTTRPDLDLIEPHLTFDYFVEYIFYKC